MEFQIMNLYIYRIFACVSHQLKTKQTRSSAFHIFQNCLPISKVIARYREGRSQVWSRKPGLWSWICFFELYHLGQVISMLGTARGGDTRHLTSFSSYKYYDGMVGSLLVLNSVILFLVDKWHINTISIISIPKSIIYMHLLNTLFTTDYKY